MFNTNHTTPACVSGLTVSVSLTYSAKTLVDISGHQPYRCLNILDKFGYHLFGYHVNNKLTH